MKKKVERVIQNASVVSAATLSTDQKNKILELFPKLKNGNVDFSVDRNLIAGFVVRQESDIFDASINGKINYLLNKIYENHR